MAISPTIASCSFRLAAISLSSDSRDAILLVHSSTTLCKCTIQTIAPISVTTHSIARTIIPANIVAPSVIYDDLYEHRQEYEHLFRTVPNHA